MTNIELLTNITQALLTDGTLASWCATHFAKGLTVFDGIITQDLPQPPDPAAAAEGDYPFAAVAIDEKETGLEAAAEEVSINIFAALLDYASYSQDQDNPGLRKLPGVTRREELRTLLLGAVEKADLGGGSIAKVQTINLPVDFHPEFGLDISLTITRPYQFRDDRIR